MITAHETVLGSRVDPPQSPPSTRRLRVVGAVVRFTTCFLVMIRLPFLEWPPLCAVLSLALGSAALLACSPAADAPPSSPPIPVTVFEVGITTTDDSQRYSASVTPYKLVKVGSQVSGTVLELATRKGADGAERALQGGDRVTAGDFLVRVDDATYREALSQAEADHEANQALLVDAKLTFDRSNELLAAGVESQADNDSSKSNYESTRASTARTEHNVEEAKVDLERCRIEATSDGLVMQREVEIGDLVQPGIEVFQIADTTRMKVVFGVSGAVARTLSPGRVLTMLVEDLNGRELAGKITRISPAADATSRLFDIEVTVANPDEALKVGMVAKLQLSGPAVQTATKDTPRFVPLDAIVRPTGQSEGHAVFVLDAAPDAASLHAELRIVEAGDVFGNEVLIRSGLAAGDLVIVRGATVVHDGADVRVMP